MSIVITGASGFIGREIIPILISSGQKLLLVGRDTEKLKKQFPGMTVTNYKNLSSDAKGFDALLHLSVLNNNKPGHLDEFRAANVTHLADVLVKANNAGIKTFIYPATLQVTNSKSSSSYTQSKKEAEAILSKEKKMSIVKLRLPIVYGTRFTGKLNFLNRLPSGLRSISFTILASLKPTVHVKNIATKILVSMKNSKNADYFVSDQQHGNWFYSFAKRTVDLGFVAFVAVFLWWVFVAAWIAVKLSSPGPGIFAQKRIGKNEKIFVCYKFRTMGVHAKLDATHNISSSEVTSVGHFLRKTKIDELPQIVNIAKNEISLIGPRPCLPMQKKLILERRKRGVFKINGGITGWAQIQGVDMRDPVRLANLDAAYLGLRSLLLDLKIALMTARGRGQGDKTG